MVDSKLAALDEQIKITRENLSELIEQAAAFSGAADEERAADRINEQESRLAALTAERDTLLGSK